MQIFKNDWQIYIGDEFNKTYYIKLRNYLAEEYRTRTIYPDMYDIFNSLHYTAYDDVRVVILGQDPYHGPNQAHGLSFSVKPNVPLPPSLQNIFKELQADLGCYIPNNGDLTYWTKQGVLLLNTVLTVRAAEANSHQGIGWETFTDKVITTLANREKPVIFILWGNNAQAKAKLISDRHFIITSPHPSPLSAHRGFFGSKPFSKTNQYLRQLGLKEIDWQIPNL